jgi:Lar family restriction alleviation protein
MTEDVLLPCPFCGGSPVFRSEMLLGKEYWRVKCPYCFAGTHNENTPEEAAEEWNRRAE